MQLVEQGKIRLEDPVQSYIPWFQIADEEASKKITIQHLLNQTSGLSTYDGQVAISQGDQTLKEHIQSLANIELTYPVGDQYQYSNLNYGILGLVVEEVTNKSYKEYINEYIFKPLEMNNSYADPKDDKNNTIADGYQTVFGMKVPTEQLIHEGTVPSWISYFQCRRYGELHDCPIESGRIQRKKYFISECHEHNASSIITNRE